MYNKSPEFIGDKEVLKKKHKTLIVVGVARGGTSLVAGTLYHMGIFCGARSKPPIFEDPMLDNLMKRGDIKNFEKKIKTYNKAHNIWVYKRPSIIEDLALYHQYWRNPVYLFIFKDIFSVANRNVISMNMSVIDCIKKAHYDYDKIVDFISNNEVNGFLFSYDKIMQNKKAFINVLSSVVDKKDDNHHNAEKFIRYDPKDYLGSSRIDRVLGNAKIVDTEIRGWCGKPGSSDPVEVKLLVNGAVKASMLANQSRPTVKEQKLYSNEFCGFQFDLANIPLSQGDIVELKSKDDRLCFTKLIYKT